VGVYIGLDQFCEYKVAAGAFTGFGNIVGGHIAESDQTLNHRDGIGGRDDMVFGMVTPKASIQSIYKGESLLDACNRTVHNGLPPTIWIRGGVLSAGTYAATIGTGYVDHVALSCGGVGEMVEALYDVIGFDCEFGSSTVATAPLATTAFSWLWGAVTVNNAAYVCQNWSAELNNNLRPQANLDVKTNGVRRLPTLIDPGNEIVSCRVALEAGPISGLDLFDDVPTLPIGITILIGNGFTTRTLTLRELYLSDMPTPFVAPDETVVWDLSLESIHNALNAASTAAWSMGALT